MLDPDASVVVNVTGSDKVVMGESPPSCTVGRGTSVGGLGDDVDASGRFGDEGLLEKLEPPPPSGGVEEDELLLDGSVGV